jgi:hypothetical protein
MAFPDSASLRGTPGRLYGNTSSNAPPAARLVRRRFPFLKIALLGIMGKEALQEKARRAPLWRNEAKSPSKSHAQSGSKKLCPELPVCALTVMEGFHRGCEA